ncbi:MULTISPECIES: formate C-acetyltransferase [Pasteurellaceae]|uniref:formate C-acetyltransferase n=1 Tax=Pasteurellaceae TaxID=712 RepID=UPI000509CB02
MTQLTEAQQKAWEGFVPGDWQTEVNVRDFIQKNYTPYEGDESFLADATEATTALWNDVMEKIKVENKTHEPYDIDTDTPSTITSHKAGYINKALEKIVGLQTDAPLKRAIMPFGGIKMVKGSCQVYRRELKPEIEHIFTEYRKTHNQGVFDVYTPDILRCRKSGVITGLPDAYGRGRIIGDYRRLAVYGVDFLMKDKFKQFTSLQPRLESGEDIQATIQLREEIAEQHRALGKIKEMAASYGCDISNPATNAQEAVQWTYFAYLAAVKSQNGAAMSFGRVSSFLDIYIERDLKAGKITEQEAQELIDHLVMKLRMVRFLRTPEYDQLFSGDPMWATETLAGMGLDGRTLVTKNSFRMLHTLYTMGPSPEPNLTILWSEQLPEAFKRFCAKVSIDTSSVQYENDDLMRPDFNNDDYAIACCVSPMVVGKQMQFFGARANLAKTLLYAINGGVDEKSGVQVGPKTAPITDEVLNFDTVMDRMDHFMDWLATQYVTALNIIHFMHDKYAYEAALMAFHDRDVFRTMACGIAGLSVAADSLAAIKYAKVKPVRGDIKDKDGNVVASNVAIDFEIEGEYPQFGNNDSRVDDLAVDLVERFMKKIQTHKTYRNATPTQSVLTITSNVVYGKKTGNTPDGRRAGAPFGPGANPMHGRDQKGAVASLTSVAKLPFAYAKDGISYTFSIVPNALGKDIDAQKRNLAGLMDGYFHHEASVEGGQHLNVNVLNRETLLDAIDHPEKYPQLTIRVSGYAVRFNSLTREQQQDVITRTFTQSM